MLWFHGTYTSNRPHWSPQPRGIDVLAAVVICLFRLLYSVDGRQHINFG